MPSQNPKIPKRQDATESETKTETKTEIEE
jgi:hypothetical protein